MRKRWLAIAGAVTIGVSWYLLLPASPVTLSLTGDAGPPIRGAIHVHTRRSDGTGTLDEVAAAARRAGLRFVIITDHGDGTRRSDTPVYRSGVLCIDAVEVSTNGGHVVALDLPEAPYPLGGEVGDVLEDVRRMGGMSIAAHPDSMRAQLGWVDWTAPVDGVEWLNGDSQWRDENWRAISHAIFTYPFRRAATLATLLDRPDDLMDRWDLLLRDRPVVAVAASDAHARFGPGADPYGRSFSLHVPSYEHVFRALSIALPDVRLSGDAREDARTVIEAIRRGHVYSTIDALAAPASVVFAAGSGSHHAVMGDYLPLDGPVMLRVEANAPIGSDIKLISDGKTLASGAPPSLTYEAPPMPGVYRVEIDVAGAPGSTPVPWVVSNPIYVGRRPAPDISPKPLAVSETRAVYSNGPASNWRIEKSVRSEGTLSVAPSIDGTQLLLRYGLGGTLSEGPYVAAVIESGSDLSRFDRVMFTARSMQPMRLMFELRASGSPDHRWGKSVYLDQDARTVTITFDEMKPLGMATGRPVLDEVRDLLFVVDTVHTKQGSSGQVWLDDISYVQ
jgi:hypothetical protein